MTRAEGSDARKSPKSNTRPPVLTTLAPAAPDPRGPRNGLVYSRSFTQQSRGVPPHGSHVWVCVLASGSRGSVVITQYQSLPLTPRKSSPYVSPSSTTPPDSLGSYHSEGGSNGFHVVRTPGLVVTSQPGPCPIKSSSQAPHALTHATRDSLD